MAEFEGVTDVDELNKVLDRAVGLRTFLTADDRIEKVAAFVAEHFKENVDRLGYKAFLVGVNREACARYKARARQAVATRLDRAGLHGKRQRRGGAPAGRRTPAFPGTRGRRASHVQAGG